MTQPFVLLNSPRGDAWFLAGAASSFTDITTSGDIVLADQRAHAYQNSEQDVELAQVCKVFLAPEKGDREGQAVQLSDDPKEQLDASLRKGDQVLIFRYKGKFHAIDNKCPHSSYPLSNGTPVDIEDFGIALSAGITCPKHGWSFDLFSGHADRGSYRLKLWEVQVRDSVGGREEDKEVWVRRKQRIG